MVWSQKQSLNEILWAILFDEKIHIANIVLKFFKYNILRIFFSVFQGYFKGQIYFMALNNKKPVKLWQELVWYGMETFGAKLAWNKVEL